MIRWGGRLIGYPGFQQSTWSIDPSQAFGAENEATNDKKLDNAKQRLPVPIYPVPLTTQQHLYMST